MDNIGVLIVDDEAIIRRSFRNKIKWDELDCSIIGEAKNAEEAYEFLKQSIPDIILLDMKMPGMGGVKFLEILSREFSSIKVIVISGFSDFEYLRQALKCGAHDYILKPVSREDLKTAVEKCSQAIMKDRNEYLKKVNDEMILNENLALLKEAILNRLISQSDIKPEQILNKLSNLKINLDCLYYCLIVIRINNFRKNTESCLNDVNLMFYTIENVSTEIASRQSICTGFKSSLIENEYVLLLGFNDDVDYITSLVTNIGKSIASSLEKHIKIEISIGVSNIVSNLTDIKEAYRNALFNLQYKKPQDFSSEDFKANNESSNVLNELIDPSFEIQISYFIDSFNKDGMSDFVFSIMEKAKSLAAFTPTDLQNFCLKILFVVEKCLSKFDITITKAMGIDIISFDYISDICDWNKAKNVIDRIFGIVFDYISNQKKMDAKKIVVRAKQYIDRNYFEDISLNSISSKYFLNTTYFCEVFKKETGYTFNDYLNYVRIQKSKEFLTNTALKLKEIAEIVGFEEQSYFSMVFKKYTGISPKDYKNSNNLASLNSIE